MKNKNKNKRQLRRRRSVGRLFLLTIMISGLMIIISVNYKIKAAVDDSLPVKEVTNATGWTIMVRDRQTGNESVIQPEQTGSLVSDPSGKVEVFGTSGQETFQTKADRITILEQAKGQLTIRDDDEVCSDGQCKEYDFKFLR